MNKQDEQFEALGFTWDWEAVPGLAPLPRRAVNQAFVEGTPRHVHNLSSIMGNPITLPEIQIMHTGMTVGGRRLEDHADVEVLLRAHKIVARKTARPDSKHLRFRLSRETACLIHRTALRREDGDPGMFRGEGTSGESQTFHFVEKYNPSPDTDGGEALRQEFETGAEFLNKLPHELERALAYYCLAVRNRFFLEGNKRAALLMTNGLLLAAGYQAITFEPSRMEQLNDHIDQFLRTGDATAVMQQLVASIDESSDLG